MGALKKVQQVQRFASAAEKENEKLRSDNERLSTIIDTGEWNKERVSDLKSAQEVLSTERVALTKLIGRLQRQHQSALDQQEQQEHEIKQLKGQLVTEVNIALYHQLSSTVVFIFLRHTWGSAETEQGSRESVLHSPYSLHFNLCCVSQNNYFERNKLLVKGASSFNTLMKVMKHDVREFVPHKKNSLQIIYTHVDIFQIIVDSYFVLVMSYLNTLQLTKKGMTAAPTTPEVMYEVNNMAMDQVST
jgi:hypothetical protein